MKPGNPRLLYGFACRFAHGDKIPYPDDIGCLAEVGGTGSVNQTQRLEIKDRSLTKTRKP